MARAKSKKGPKKSERLIGGLILGGTAAGLLYYWYQSKKSQPSLPPGTSGSRSIPPSTSTPPRTSRTPQLSDRPPWNNVREEEDWENGSGSTGGVVDW